MNEIQSRWLGLYPYEKALEQQIITHKRVLSGHNECILGVEHPPVITLGKRGGVIRKKNTAPIVQINRGGLATAHEPGQLSIYPIINLEKRKIKVRTFVCILEKGVMEWLSNLGLQPKQSQSPGIWIKEKKICSIGLQIKSGVSLHGIAINIHNSLQTFLHIEACGFSQNSMGALWQFHSNLPDCETAFQSLSSILIDRIENI